MDWNACSVKRQRYPGDAILLTREVSDTPKMIDENAQQIFLSNEMQNCEASTNSNECWPQYHFRGISVKQKHFSSKWLSDRIWKLSNGKKHYWISSFPFEKASRARHEIFIRICQRYVNDLCDSVGMTRVKYFNCICLCVSRYKSYKA